MILSVHSMFVATIGVNTVMIDHSWTSNEACHVVQASSPDRAFHLPGFP